MYSKLNKLTKELALLGVKGTVKRCLFEAKRRSGLDLLIKKSLCFDVERYILNIRGCELGKENYIEGWRSIKPYIGLANHIQASEYLKSLLTLNEQKELIAKAKRNAKFEFQQFGRSWVKYSVLDWYSDPIERLVWPKEHSSKLLLKLSQYGDIKLVWELGRFTWVFNLIRAWLVDGDSGHIDTLFLVLDDFIENNPLYIGPQWASEQEVAIRAVMLVFAQEVLQDSLLLSNERLLRLHTLLEMHAIYLEHDLDYAESAIRNNHLIHGALGLYIISNIMPWHKKAKKWSRTSKKILKEAAFEQWYSDGGYVQPSHNYHRSAWHGMLWARMVAKHCNDIDLFAAIDLNLEKSFNLLTTHINVKNGQLPNWGANDGTLIGSWTECDYSDFRPLVQVMSILVRGSRAFKTGPWDEEVFWFLGSTHNVSHVESINQDAASFFDKQGLAVIRRDINNFGVLRCGTPLSRYGQQADQLHVDLWTDGVNLALDSGSYNYNRSLHIHNWFRGTRSHNTIIINEQDQMIPHRTFKYLRWVKAKGVEFNICSGKAFLGVHHGYTRLKGSWCHARVLMQVDDDWLILDRVWPTEILEKTVSIRLHWQFSIENYLLDIKGQQAVLNSDKYRVNLQCSYPNPEYSSCTGQERPLEGWHSRYYNIKEPAVALNAVSMSSEETWFLSVVQSAASEKRYRLKDEAVIRNCSDVQISFKKVRDISNKLIMELVNIKK